METDTQIPEIESLEAEVEAFARSLSDDGVKGDALHREMGRVRLFLFHYLHGFSGLGVEAIEPRHLIDFVGTWLIRHVSNVTPESIRSILHTLGTYFHQRADRGALSEETQQGIEKVLRNEGFFLTRLADYADSVGDEDAFDTWLEKRWGWVNITDEAREALFRPLATDRSLLQAIGEDDAPPLGEDFVRLLAGLREVPARLGKTRRRLSAATVEALNDRLDDPDPLPKRPRQSDAPRINALFSAAVRLGLCGLEKGGRVAPSASAESIEAMGRRERLALLLDTIWNQVPWSDLASRSAPEDTPDLYALRAWLARALARLPQDRPTMLRPARGRPTGPLGLLVELMEDEPGLIECLLPVFERARVWEVDVSRAASRRPRIRSLRPTPLGHRLFTFWSADTEGAAPPEPFDAILAGSPENGERPSS